MNFAKNVLAISVALAVSGVAGAATKTGEEDSVREWGRWSVLMPAAGDVAEHPVEPRIAGRDFRPEDAEQFERIAERQDKPREEPREEPRYEGMCQAGASCGYATYEYRYYMSGNDGYGGYGGEGGYYSDGGEGAPVPASMNLNVQFPAAESVQAAAVGTPPADGGEAGVIADFTVGPRQAHANYPTVADRHAEEDHIHSYEDGSVYWHAENDTYTSPDGGEGNTWVEINGVMVPELIENTTAGWWSEGNYSYDYYSSQEFDRSGSYVAGTATGLAFLDSLNAGNVEARYVGFAMDSQVDVVMDIDFGAATWSGSWNGGQDGNVYNYTDENGQNYVRGEVGFNASGYISGPNIVSTSVSAADAASITGHVDGSFFGSEAQVLGGVSDITKTVTEATVGEGGTVYDASRNVDTFVTVEESIADQVIGSEALRDE